MIKRLAPASLVLVLGCALAGSAAPAGAADCGLIALLSPCAAPAPAPLPIAAPVPAVPALPVVPAVPAVTEPVVTPAPAPVAPVAARTPVAAAADRLLQLVNEARAGSGLPALSAHAGAASIAAGHSMAMAERGQIFHNPAYLTASTRSQLGAKALGENVAMNGTIEAAHQRLLASPGHRANILDGTFDAVGMAVVRDAAGTLFITQDFLDSVGTGGSAPKAAAPRAAVTTAAKPATAPTPARPAPVYRAASTPAPAAPAPPAPATPDAVLSAGDSTAGATVAAADVPAASTSNGRLMAFAAGALALLIALVGGALRFVAAP